MVFQSIATPSAELEYVSDRDDGFKQPLERCKLLTRWAFEYFDQTAAHLSRVGSLASSPNQRKKQPTLSGRASCAGPPARHVEVWRHRVLPLNQPQDKEHVRTTLLRRFQW